MTRTGTAVDQGDRRSWRSALEVASVGIEMAVAVTVGWFAGDALDGWLGTSPWMTGLFLVAGTGAAFKALWRSARRNWPRD
jgi:F0F1-type ATP synthase assembly protein I